MNHVAGQESEEAGAEHSKAPGQYCKSAGARLRLELHFVNLSRGEQSEFIARAEGQQA